MKRFNSDTRDEEIGWLYLDLNKIPLPADLQSCTLKTLENKAVDLFSLEAPVVPTQQSKDADLITLDMISTSRGYLIRQISGYWPITKRRSFGSTRRKVTGKVFLTI